MVKIGLTDTKFPPKGPPGAPKRSQRRPQNALKTIFGSKKRANEAQESSKTNLEALFGRSRGPPKLPRSPQELPNGARESPKTLSKPYLDPDFCVKIWRVRPGTARERKAPCALLLGCVRLLSFDLVYACAPCLCSARDLVICSCFCYCSCSCS